MADVAIEAGPRTAPAHLMACWGMPFTLFAHQAPVVPIGNRWSGRLDGVALVVGSMAPDLARFSSALGYGGIGHPMWIDGHNPMVQPWLAVWSAVAAVVLRRWLIPVAARCAPPSRWHLADLQLVARRRYRPVVVWFSSLIGAATHLFLDSFTHEDRPVARLMPVLRIRLADLGPRYLTVAGVLQIVLSVVLGVWCLRVVSGVMLRRELPGRYGLTEAEADSVEVTYSPRTRRTLLAVAGVAVVPTMWVGTNLASQRSDRTLVVAVVVVGLIVLGVGAGLVTIIGDRLATARVTSRG